MQCSRCRRDFGGFFNMLTADLANPLCPRCDAERVREKHRAEDEANRRAKEDRRELEARAEEVLLTTTPAVDGRRATAYLGIESAEVVIGTGLFSELSGDISDFLGQRSKAFEKKLQQAKDVAFQMLRVKAARKGADAVIAVDMDYTEFSGNRVALIVNGTLVRLATEFGDLAPAPAARRAEPPPVPAASNGRRSGSGR